MVPADPEHPEHISRRQIDAMLLASGWDVQDRAAMNLAAAPRVAIEAALGVMGLLEDWTGRGAAESGRGP